MKIMHVYLFFLSMSPVSAPLSNTGNSFGIR